MKTFKVAYVEKLVHTFYIDAENEKAAVNEFYRKSEDGELDFGCGEIDNTWIKYVEEVGK